MMSDTVASLSHAKACGEIGKSSGLRSPVFKGRAKKMENGHGENRRPATRPPETNDPQRVVSAIRVRVAERDAPRRRDNLPRHVMRRTQDVPGESITACQARSILGTGSGKRHPRPSSREPAQPPRWVRDRDKTASRPTAGTGRCKELTRAERIEAGPGPGAGR